MPPPDPYVIWNLTASNHVAILALLVALVGPVLAWIVPRSRNSLDRNEAVAQRTHERQLARDQRQQDRPAALYVDVLDFTNLLGMWVDRTKPTPSAKPSEPRSMRSAQWRTRN